MVGANPEPVAACDMMLLINTNMVYFGQQTEERRNAMIADGCMTVASLLPHHS